jgi:hypothetical protein
VPEQHENHETVAATIDFIHDADDFFRCEAEGLSGEFAEAPEALSRLPPRIPNSCWIDNHGLIMAAFAGAGNLAFR